MTTLPTLPTPLQLLRRPAALLLVMSAPLVLGACQLERLFPEPVGAGAARLTVRNAAILAKLVDDDLTCGFDSEVGKYSYVVDGEVGTVGTVTWTVTDCAMDFGAPHVTSTDCLGDERSVGGRMTITAVREVRGMITGDRDTPVVPLDNDAVHLRYDATVEDYVVQLTSSENAGTIQKGRLHFEAEVHLAQSASMGICGVDTSELTIEKLTLDDAVMTIDQGGSAFDVEVPHAEMFAQLGAWEGKENHLAGRITVWDTDVDLNVDHVLDPEYDRDTFRASYACKEDLQVPQSYSCPDISEAVVGGASRLVLNDVGNAVQLAVNDTTCGFASPSVIESARVVGAVGYPGGEATYVIDEPCTITIPEGTVLSENCLGSQTRVAGGDATMTIRATMRQRGRVTGDPQQPIIPGSRDAVDIDFDVSFQGFGVQSGEAEKFLVIDQGGATGRMSPRLALDDTTGACSLPTSVVRFDNISIKPETSGLLRSGLMAVQIDFADGALSAQVGNKDGDENRLTGTATASFLGNAPVTVDVGGDLDPDYDPSVGDATFTCTPHLVVPQSDADCSFDTVLAENSARLAIQTTGTLASMINADDNCGFEDTFGVLLWPTDVVGSNGEMGSMTWDVHNCSIDRAQDTVMSQDCSGGETYVEGLADFVNVGRTVRGERDKMILNVVIDSIIPRAEDSVDVFLREVELHEFATWSIAGNADEPAGILVIHEGTLSATVQPALGENADDAGTFDVPTPVARLSSVRLSGDASLYAQGKVFHFRIDNTELLATNGPFKGQENSLSGTIGINGQTHTVDVPLNPDYAPTSFDAAYQCTESLAGPVR